MKISATFSIFPPKIIIPPREIACTSLRVKQSPRDHIKSLGGHTLSSARYSHQSPCSHAEITNLVELSTFFYFPTKNYKSGGKFPYVIIFPPKICYSSPRHCLYLSEVKQPWGGTFKPLGGQSLSSARLSIPPRVILSITILEFPANSGGFPRRDVTFLPRNKGILIFPKIDSFLGLMRCFAEV